MLNRLFFLGDIAYEPEPSGGSDLMAIVIGLVIIALVIAIIIIKRKNRRP